MMTAQPLDQWPKWRDQLVYHLRMAEVPGDRIGDILLEVESHVRDTGESPERAFGSPKEYAASRGKVTAPVDNSNRSRWGSTLSAGIGSFVGSALYASGAMAMGRGGDAFLGLDGWLALVLGFALLAITLARLPIDLVRHPDTGSPMLGGTRNLQAITLIVIIALGVAFYFVGRTLA